jgi:UDP-N-acetylglucosamine pyrophosphorylase
MNPDGHGGVFRALRRSGLLEKMKARHRGDLHLPGGQPLVKICDPCS